MNLLCPAPGLIQFPWLSLKDCTELAKNKFAKGLLFFLLYWEQEQAAASCRPLGVAKLDLPRNMTSTLTKYTQAGRDWRLGIVEV